MTMPELKVEQESTNHLTTFRLTDAHVAAEVKELAAKLREPYAAGVRKIGEGPGRKLSECDAEIRSFNERMAQAVREREQAEADLAKALKAHDEKGAEQAQHAIEVAEQQRRGHNRSIAIWRQTLDEARQQGAQPLAEALESLRQKYVDKLKSEWQRRTEEATTTLHALAVELLAYRNAWEHVAHAAGMHPDDVLAANGGQPLGTKPKPVLPEIPPPATTTIDSAGRKSTTFALRLPE
jgi:chromosome segregation ATPase